MSTMRQYINHITAAKRALGLVLIEESEGSACYEGILDQWGYCRTLRAGADELIWMSDADHERKKSACLEIDRYFCGKASRET